MHHRCNTPQKPCGMSRGLSAAESLTHQRDVRCYRFFRSATQQVWESSRQHEDTILLFILRHSHSSFILTFFWCDSDSDFINFHLVPWQAWDISGFPDLFFVQDWCSRVSFAAHRRAAAALCVANSTANSVALTCFDCFNSMGNEERRSGTGGSQGAIDSMGVHQCHKIKDL